MANAVVPALKNYFIKNFNRCKQRVYNDNVKLKKTKKNPARTNGVRTRML